MLIAQLTVAECETVSGVVSYFDNEGVTYHDAQFESGRPDGCDEGCAADLDGNGVVGLADLLAVISAWGRCDAECPEDLDGSGFVDIGDLLIMLSSWAPCE